MSFITADFETFYGDGLGFKTQTNEEYLRDPRFHVIGVSVKVDDGPTQWFSGSMEDTKNWLLQFDWDGSALLAHNALFDGAILAWHFGIVPAFYYDTLCMARAIHGVEAGGSLAALTEYYGIGVKGNEVVNAYNKRRVDFDQASLERYAAYCCNDVELTYKLFQILHEVRPVSDNNVMEIFKYLNTTDRPKVFAEEEYALIDMTLRMYIQPTLRVDDALLVTRLDEIKAEKSNLLSGLMGLLDVGSEEEVRAKLSSNKQFAEILKDLDVPVPMKISPTTGKETYALAKKDEGFLELLEHPEPTIQQLCTVRLGTKSTMEESRILRFIEIGGRNQGWLPIPLKYYGAHTGRWAGMDAVNFQNLPSRDKKKKALKRGLVPPPGYVVINSDSSQIEARVLAWLAGQEDLVTQFRHGEDVYSIFASKIFKRKITKADEIERFVGKTCVAEGTLVLSDRGWVPVEQVTLSDKVWDGEEWVCHSGVVSNGTKETLPMYGLWLTPDHQVWSGTWQRADYLLQDEDTLYQALGIAAGNLPSQAMWLAPEDYDPCLCSANAGPMNTRLTPTTSRILSQLAARYAREALALKNAIGDTLKHYLMTFTDPASLIVWQQQSHAATRPAVAYTDIMESEAYMSATNGGLTEQRSCVTSNLWPGGINPNTRWIELMSMGRTRRVISGSSLAQRIFGTREKSRTLKPVYDILNSGSRNRFTVLTERGPLIVHNCILGLGFGTGAAKLQHTLLTTPPGATLSLVVCGDIVNIYRAENYMIPRLWEQCEMALRDIMAWPEGKQPYWLNDLKGVVEVTPEGFRLPNGLYIRYPNLRRETDSKGRPQYFYDSRKGPQKTWGGSIVENIVQALARIIVGEQMIKINQRYRVALTVHDAAVTVVPEDERVAAMQYITKVMSTPPAWGPLLPIACEASWGPSYGECLTDEQWNKLRGEAA